MADGASRWITGEPARAYAHLERARADAILVGRGTIEADAPRLDVRLPGLEERTPVRWMLGSGEAPDGWKAIRNPDEIADMPADWLLIEGGARSAASFLAADLVDRLLLYRAPIRIGEGKAALGDLGLESLADAHGRWRLNDARQLGADRIEDYERVCSPA